MQNINAKKKSKGRSPSKEAYEEENDIETHTYSSDAHATVSVLTSEYGTVKLILE